MRNTAIAGHNMNLRSSLWVNLAFMTALSVPILVSCSQDDNGKLIEQDGDTSTLNDGLDAVLPDDLTSQDKKLPPDGEDGFDEKDSVGGDTGFDLEFWAGDSVVPEPGQAGYPCNSGAQCDSGYCIQTADGMKCTVSCETECPFGWKCVQYTPSLPDQVFVCVPPFVDICRPCTTNTECWTGGIDAGQKCVEYGGAGAFCGGPCQTSKDCPSDYECATSTDVSGSSSSQCTKKNAECTCSKKAIDEGATTQCSQSNEFGTCVGQRKCTAGGLTDCLAPLPAQETCNAVDDNCNGEVDEGLSGGDCLVINSFGACPGTLMCVAGISSCQGPEPLKEACNGKDDDCDGDTDEGFPDSDGDGVADCLEIDKDGDGIPDVMDNCPSVVNPLQSDFDFDTIGDACDPDDDNDLTPDDQDCAPLDPTIHPKAKEICDGKDNDCNYIVDEGFPDSDFDGWKDCVDEDDDNDGVKDEADCAPLDPEARPGLPEVCDGKDNDCDGEVDEGFPDMDKDGKADCADDDIDGDGKPNKSDNCPQVPNPDQADMDGDGLGNVCDLDADGDSIPDVTDNCPGLKNPLQGDIDKDGKGDDCDDDIDGDGKPNTADNCPLIPNPDQTDTDKDGVGDACANDKDGDGTPDSQDCAPTNPDIHPKAQELCDGVDNNCNGLVDEGFIDTDGDLLKDCVDPDDDNDLDPDQTDCAPLVASIHHGAVEVCDGLDNDCDGLIDEELGTLACGKGICFHSVQKCKNGALQSCDPLEGATQEICDGLDNDCDGLTDEDLGTTTCGLGICVHTVPKCIGGKPNACDPKEGATVEICDGLDNDCDGKTDEELGVVSCGIGICVHSEPACIGGVETVCDPKKGAMPEMCDGLDNDCDGETDEDLGTTSCGKGLCFHTIQKCLNGELQICDPFEGAQPEICDGLDNDCNGLVDESQGTTFCGTGVCWHMVQNCKDGQIQVCDPMEGASQELCDGLDNNCDGLVDNGLPPITCGIGPCEHTIKACDEGKPQICDPMEGSVPEICDGQDNDCDGKRDNGFPDTDGDDMADCVDDDDDNDGDPDITDCDPLDPGIGNLAEEICFNEIDEDCDGLTDLDPDCMLPSCLELLKASPQLKNGLYTLDPDAGGPLPSFKAYCDMTTDGGGWTMCYTEKDAMVHIKTEVTYNQAKPYGTVGYRSDCRNVPFDQVMYVNHDSGQVARFARDVAQKVKVSTLGYFVNGSVLGEWTSKALATTSYKYQLNICDDGWMWVGFMMSGYGGCWKACNSWCGDTSQVYFRTDGDDGPSYNGVSFNQNGHTNVTYKTMSVGIR